ncbi:uncharacterized protein LOC113866544 [Abrus precatorius]|uniref:Uncharacterized protein LOC113866544 n=1 Tax=Abrus precatorius TaxID=3816 RepID=A0A8B8LML9_ABRPR|nr:uncharacterized protein LOC113866544 [Abrus precatorius]
MSTTQVTRDALEYLVFKRDNMESRGQWEFRVHLTERLCDCGEFQKLHYPCCHALAACSDARRDWTSFVHDVYTMKSVFNVYKAQFSSIPNEDMWSPYIGLPIRPNPTLKRSLEGRSVSTRFHNKMDENDLRQGKRCGLCRGNGHTKRTCPHAPSFSQNN